MLTVTIRRLTLLSCAGLLFACGSLLADDDSQGGSSRSVIGSWFGRAVPVPGQTVCPPGSPGCAVPPEIVMVFTIHADGTFIGIDSNIFAGGNHTTAHGEWTPTGAKSIRATFTLLQSAPGGLFIGGFKNLFEANVVDNNHLTGNINAYLYRYTDNTGRVVTDGNGFPTPSPLAPPSACSTTPGCLNLGKFTFKVQRVAVE